MPDPEPRQNYSSLKLATFKQRLLLRIERSGFKEEAIATQLAGVVNSLEEPQFNADGDTEVQRVHSAIGFIGDYAVGIVRIASNLQEIKASGEDRYLLSELSRIVLKRISLLAGSSFDVLDQTCSKETSLEMLECCLDFSRKKDRHFFRQIGLKHAKRIYNHSSKKDLFNDLLEIVRLFPKQEKSKNPVEHRNERLALAGLLSDVIKREGDDKIEQVYQLLSSPEEDCSKLVARTAVHLARSDFAVRSCEVIFDIVEGQGVAIPAIQTITSAPGCFTPVLCSNGMLRSKAIEFAKSDNLATFALGMYAVDSYLNTIDTEGDLPANIIETMQQSYDLWIDMLSPITENESAVYDAARKKLIAICLQLAIISDQ